MDLIHKATGSFFYLSCLPNLLPHLGKLRPDSAPFSTQLPKGLLNIGLGDALINRGTNCA